MTPPAPPPSTWSTSCFGDSTDTTPMELSALGEHASLCSNRGRRFGVLHWGALAVHGLVVGRFVTTLAVAAVLIGLALLVA